MGPKGKSCSSLVRLDCQISVLRRVLPPSQAASGAAPKSSAPGSAFGACVRLGAFGAHWLLGFIPLTTNCWPEAPFGGGGGLLAS